MIIKTLLKLCLGPNGSFLYIESLLQVHFCGPKCYFSFEVEIHVFSRKKCLKCEFSVKSIQRGNFVALHRAKEWSYGEVSLGSFLAEMTHRTRLAIIEVPRKRFRPYPKCILSSLILIPACSRIVICDNFQRFHR